MISRLTREMKIGVANNKDGAEFDIEVLVDGVWKTVASATYGNYTAMSQHLLTGQQALGYALSAMIREMMHAAAKEP